MDTGPANTVGYFIAGYGVIFGTMFLYLISLVVRTLNLSQDEAILKDLDKETES
jgi:hypothetical protein